MENQKLFHAPSCHKIATSKSQGIIAPPEQQPSLQTVLDWMRSKLTNKLLPKMGRLFLGYVWRFGRAKLDFWLSLNLNCTEILATQTFWELWPQNCARPDIKKNQKAVENCAKAGHNCGNRHQFSRRNCSSVFAPFPSDLHLVARIAVKKCRF